MVGKDHSRYNGSANKSTVTMAYRVIRVFALFLTSFTLASCVIHQASIDRTSPSPTAPIEIIQIVDTREAKLSSFWKLVLNPPKGSIVGRQKSHSFCMPQRELKWERDSQVLDEDDIRAAFNEVLQKGSYPVAGKVDVLFQNVPEPDLILAGLVKELKADICHETTMGILVATQTVTKTDLFLKVHWQVFGPAQQKVIYETTTEGKYHGIGSFRACVIAAFANATERLLAERAFFELVVAPKKTKM
jgi:hypothetical protein